MDILHAINEGLKVLGMVGGCMYLFVFFTGEPKEGRTITVGTKGERPSPEFIPAENPKKRKYTKSKPVLITGKPTPIRLPSADAIEKAIAKEAKPKRKYKRREFIIPTVDEVMTYCKERGNSVDPNKFVDFYTSKGWMVGKNPMKNWEAAVRTWERHGVMPTLNTKKEAPKVDRLDPSREFTTSEADIKLARIYLGNWMRSAGALTEDQILAFRGTSGLLWKSMSEPQRAQIISVFNDVRKKRGLIK